MTCGELVPVNSGGDLCVYGAEDGQVLHPVMRYLLSYSSKISRRVMRSHLRLAVRAAGGDYDLKTFPWHKLDDVEMNLILQRVNENHAPNTVYAVRVALLGIAKIMWLDGEISERRYARIRAVKNTIFSRNPRGRMLSPDELRRIFAYFNQHDSAISARDACMISLLAECGLRRAECASVLYEKIDLQDKSFSIIGKRNKERTCYIPPGAERYLKNYLTFRGDEPGPLLYSLTKTGDLTFKGITAQAIYYRVKWLAQELGLGDFSPHDLRRTFASALLEQGEDLLTVRDLMGHQSVMTTQRYDKRGEDNKRKAASQLRLAV